MNYWLIAAVCCVVAVVLFGPRIGSISTVAKGSQALPKPAPASDNRKARFDRLLLLESLMDEFAVDPVQKQAILQEQLTKLMTTKEQP